MGFESVLEYARFAPSGDNCQPWKFVLQQNRVFLYNIPERDTSLYNFDQRASWLAHGAVLENIAIASKGLGWKIEIKIFPDNNDINLVAEIHYSKVSKEDSPLLTQIKKRATNRKKYLENPVPSQLLIELTEKVAKYSGVKLFFAQSPDAIKMIAQAASVNEQIVLENRRLHNFLFNHIVWTSAEAKRKKVGLFVKTLEIPPPAILMMKLASSWERVRLLNRLGFSKIISSQNKSIYERTAAFGLVTVNIENPTQLIIAGRAIQKIWLTVSRENFSLHPLTGIVFLQSCIEKIGNKEISVKHGNMIGKSHNAILQAFSNVAGRAVFLFRLGQSQNPSAISPRMDLKQVTETIPK